ncbi:amidase family protein [Pseudonocardia benzenivorans]
MEASGATTVEVVLPLRAELMTADIVTTACEALAYHRTDMTTRWDDYFAATRAMIARGAMVSGADYVQAQRMRRAGQLALGRLFAEVDVVACPTISVGAPALQGYLDGTTEIMELFAHIHTGYWDSVGNPVLALPMGATASGMPLSLQLAGRPFEEAMLLRAGSAFQARTTHHLYPPSPQATRRSPREPRRRSGTGDRHDHHRHDHHRHRPLADARGTHPGLRRRDRGVRRGLPGCPRGGRGALRARRGALPRPGAALPGRRRRPRDAVGGPACLTPPGAA